MLRCGSSSWTRTNDPAVNSRMLYQLSYRGIFVVIISATIVIILYLDIFVNIFLKSFLYFSGKELPRFIAAVQNSLFIISLQ